MKNILIVDDDQDILRELRESLTENGYNVTFAADGSDAFEMLSSHNFDAAIIDIQIPNLTGIELLQWIKSKKSNTPVIIMSGHSDYIHIHADEIARANKFISKPFGIKDMLSALKEIVV